MANSNGPGGTFVKSNSPALPDSNSAAKAPEFRTIFAPSTTAPSLSMTVPLMLPVPPGVGAFGSCSGLAIVEDAEGTCCDCADSDTPNVPSRTPTAVRHSIAKRRMRDGLTSTGPWLFLVRQCKILRSPTLNPLSRASQILVTAPRGRNLPSARGSLFQME